MEPHTQDKDNPLILLFYGAYLQAKNISSSLRERLNKTTGRPLAVAGEFRSGTLKETYFHGFVNCDTIPAHFFGLEENLNHSQFIIALTTDNVLNVIRVNTIIQSNFAKDKILSFMETVKNQGTDTLALEYCLLIEMNEPSEYEEFVFTSDRCVMPESVFEAINDDFESDEEDLDLSIGRRIGFDSNRYTSYESDDEDDADSSDLELDSDDEDYLSSTPTMKSSIGGNNSVSTETAFTSRYSDDLGAPTKRSIVKLDEHGNFVEIDRIANSANRPREVYELLTRLPKEPSPEEEEKVLLEQSWFESQTQGLTHLEHQARESITSILKSKYYPTGVQVGGKDSGNGNTPLKPSFEQLKANQTDSQGPPVWDSLISELPGSKPSWISESFENPKDKTFRLPQPDDFACDYTFSIIENAAKDTLARRAAFNTNLSNNICETTVSTDVDSEKAPMFSNKDVSEDPGGSSAYSFPNHLREEITTTEEISRGWWDETIGDSSYNSLVGNPLPMKTGNQDVSGSPPEVLEASVGEGVPPDLNPLSRKYKRRERRTTGMVRKTKTVYKPP